MNSGIPFIRIADRVEVDVDLQATRTSPNISRGSW